MFGVGINDDTGDIGNVGEDPVIVLFSKFNVSVRCLQ